MLTAEEAAAFAAALNKLYTASKTESRAGFPHFRKAAGGEAAHEKDKTFRPDRVLSYFKAEWLPLVLSRCRALCITSACWQRLGSRGRLAQCLADILGGSETAAKMAMLVLAYIVVTLAVQAARFIKRFYVRRFANNINRRMKGILYANLVRQSRAALEKEGAGELMTKAISDVDDCVEGMRKFTTEIFDTGVALVGYAVMLLVYDWRLALLSLLFTPFSYMCAAWMKKPVQRAGAAYKKAASALSAATLDRARNAVTYRIYGCEDARIEKYEEALNTYEKQPCATMCGSPLCRRCIWQRPRQACCSFCGSALKMCSALAGAHGTLRRSPPSFPASRNWWSNPPRWQSCSTRCRKPRSRGSASSH